LYFQGEKIILNDIKAFVDGKLCENEKVLGDFGHKYISYPLNLDDNSHNVTVAIDNIMHSSVIFAIIRLIWWQIVRIFKFIILMQFNILYRIFYKFIFE
jgi:hypothetical protein